MVVCAEVFQGKLWLWVSGWHGPNLQFWNNCKTFPKQAKCICTAPVWVFFGWSSWQVKGENWKGHLLSLRYLCVLVLVLCWGKYKGCQAHGWPSWPLIGLSTTFGTFTCILIGQSKNQAEHQNEKTKSQWVKTVTWMTRCISTGFKRTKITRTQRQDYKIP